MPGAPRLEMYAFQTLGGFDQSGVVRDTEIALKPLHRDSHERD
jgi:hypothetical protein